MFNVSVYRVKHQRAGGMSPEEEMMAVLGGFGTAESFVRGKYLGGTHILAMEYVGQVELTPVVLEEARNEMNRQDELKKAAQ